MIMKENLRFKQLRLNCINNQRKQIKKEHLRLVIGPIRMGLVSRTIHCRLASAFLKKP